MAIHLKILRKASGWRQQMHGALCQAYDSHMPWNLRVDLNPIILVPAKGVVALPQPGEADEREPSLRRLEIRRALCPQRLKFSLPGSVFRRGRKTRTRQQHSDRNCE